MDAIDIIMWIAFGALLVGGIRAAVELPEFLRRPSGKQIGAQEYLVWGIKWILGILLLVGLINLFILLYRIFKL